METRIIGLDPGTLHAGYGVIAMSDNGVLRRIAGGCIHAPAGEAVPERLAIIYRGLREVIETYRPQEASVETVFTGKNARVALTMGEGRGIALLSVSIDGIPVFNYEPRLVKKTVAGSGSASKEQIQRMTAILLQMPSPAETDHEADALALAIAHAVRKRSAMQTGSTSISMKKGKVKNRSLSSLPPSVLAQLPDDVKRKKKT